MAKLIQRLGANPALVAASANRARLVDAAEPGLTDDAKRVVEAVSHRALERRHEPSTPDLLLALTVADTPARDVLDDSGIIEPAVRALVE